ncbi:MAG TPA: glycosyltransferase family A protein [Gammaproteobacteria bacterium]|nr:glycosyltransferase family A protein [Gammaproteobacteria bacterium]
MIYVCILTHNRLNKLRHLIDNPFFWRGFDECVVLAQGCDDGTNEWLSQYATAHPDKQMILWQSWQNLRAIGGRQRMVDRMLHWLDTDDIVIMLDDDMLPISPEWARRLCQPILDDPEIGASGVGGHDITWGPQLIHEVEPGWCDVVNGGWTAYRASLFLEGVEFDQAYLPFWHCDIDLAMQIRQKGYKIWCTGRVGLAHEAHHWDMDEHYAARCKMFKDKWMGKGLTQIEQILRIMPPMRDGDVFRREVKTTLVEA